MSTKFNDYIVKDLGLAWYGDIDTVDLFTTIISEFEKHAWFLRATSET